MARATGTFGRIEIFPRHGQGSRGVVPSDQVARNRRFSMSHARIEPWPACQAARLSLRASGTYSLRALGGCLLRMGCCHPVQKHIASIVQIIASGERRKEQRIVSSGKVCLLLAGFQES
jgi:hypothetical protein